MMSGARKDIDNDLFCRTCGRMCDMEHGRLWCSNGCFSEAYRPEAAED